MRTKHTRLHSDGTTTETWLEDDDIPDYLADQLSTLGLVSLTKRWRDGSESTYTALEFRCEWCGEYEHGIDNCPNFTDQDDGDASIDDAIGEIP